MDFQEKQKEIINLRKEIEEKIKTLEEKQREVTKILHIGMTYVNNSTKDDKKYVIELIKTKEGNFPYRQLYISDANGVGLLPMERVNLLNEEEIRTWNR